jgi:hypothetical protein
MENHGFVHENHGKSWKSMGKSGILMIKMDENQNYG